MVLLRPIQSEAEIIAGPFTNPANEHTYFLLGPNTWSAAETEAVRLGGHLVTIRNAAEQAWIYSTIVPHAGANSLWIGLTDRQVEGSYRWISGEPFNYENWDAGEPNNSNGVDQDYAHLYAPGVQVQGRDASGKWDDRSESQGQDYYAIAEVFSRKGILAGPITNPQNGHRYYLLGTNSWSRAEEQAVQLGGHLVTINDADEQEWVFATFSPHGAYKIWIGLTDRITEGSFQWVSGEPFTYENWNDGEPNNSNGLDQDYAHLIRAGTAAAGKWNDEVDDPPTSCYAIAEVSGSVLELSIATAIKLVWPTQPGKSYQLQYSSLSTGNVWLNLGDPILATSDSANYVDSTQGSEKRFYQVLLKD